jgi:hypothetical protein
MLLGVMQRMATLMRDMMPGPMVMVMLKVLNHGRLMIKSIIRPVGITSSSLRRT